jgi:voltage-gated potassium channel
VEQVRRLWVALIALGLVLVGGTVGYVVLGFGVLDAIYQTVTTVTTVGFREVRPFGRVDEAFTIVLILVGVGVVLYTFGVALEALIDGHLRDVMRRSRMDRDIAGMQHHAIVCGWGRVGKATAGYLSNAGRDVVVIDSDPDRIATVPYPRVLGDVTDDATLRKAGIERAGVLIAAVNTDADNVYVTLSGRTLRPDLLIIARARTEASEAKLQRAGADRVVNPQRIGGDRMASFALQPHVVEFLEGVIHDGSLEFQLAESPVAVGSALAGKTVHESHIRRHTGALLIAVRGSDGAFTTNPPPDWVIQPGQILIAIGSEEQQAALHALAGRARSMTKAPREAP